MKKIIQFTFSLLFILGSIQTTNAAFIRRSKLKKKSVSGFRTVVVVGKKVGDISSAVATIAAKDKESPQPIIKSFAMKASTNNKGNYELEADLTCERGICLFAKNEDPIGKTYTLTLTFKDKNGKTVGSPESVDVVAELDRSVCATNIKIKEISITNLNFYYPQTSANANSQMLVVRRKDEKNDDLPASVSFRLEPFAAGKGLCAIPFYTVIVEYVVPGSDVINTYTTTAKYNEKSKTYTANWMKKDSAYTYSFWIRPTSKSEGWRPNFNKPTSITSTQVSFATKKGQIENETSNNEDSTKNDFVIQDGVQIDSKIVGNIQALTLSKVTIINKNKSSNDIPKVKALVYLKSCNGKVLTISVEMKYNEKTKTYIGSQSLPLCNNKGNVVESVSIIVENGGTLWTRSELTHF